MPAPKGAPRFNPRGGDRRGQRPLTQRPASTLWYGLAFLLLLAMAQMYYLASGARQIPYSEFKSLLKQAQIAELTTGEQTIRGTLKPAPGTAPQQAKQSTTTRVQHPK